MNSVILPTQENGFHPPVKSFVLRRAGAKAGIRLIDYSSLVGFIRAHESTVDLVVQPAAEAPLLPQLATHPASSETATH